MKNLSLQFVDLSRKEGAAVEIDTVRIFFDAPNAQACIYTSVSGVNLLLFDILKEMVGPEYNTSFDTVQDAYEYVSRLWWVAKEAQDIIRQAQDKAQEEARKYFQSKFEEIK